MYSFNNAGTILVILDDVWSEIPFNNIGIPFDNGSSNTCTILLTSRMEDACLRNSCDHLVEVKALIVDEAWDMFKNTVGISKIDSLQEELVAQKDAKYMLV